MLSLLSMRETGLDHPGYLCRAESTRRAFTLELSKYQDVQKVHDGAVNTLDIDPVEDRYLLSGAGNGTIVIHDLHNTSGLPQFTHPRVSHVGRGNPHRHKFSVESVQWYPLDTGMFLTGGMDKLLKVWDTNTMRTADEYEFSGGVYNHHMSPVAVQHSLVAVATTSSKVKLLDLKSGSATHTLRGHKQAVYTVAWSTRDEYLLATGSADSKVMLWDVRSARGALRVLDQHNNDTTADPNSVNTAHDGRVTTACYTPDGLHLVTFGTDFTLRLWSTLTGSNTMVNYGQVKNDSKRTVKIAISGGTSPPLVFVPSGSDLEVLDMWSGSKLNTLQGHYNQVNSCVYRETYQKLYSCGQDRNILIWTPLVETVLAYEHHLAEGSRQVETARSGFVRRVVSGDAWSSDED